jgi:streptogrisin D
MGRGISRRPALLTAAVGLALGIATAVPASAAPAAGPAGAPARAATPVAATTDAAIGQLAAAAGISRTEAAGRLATQAANVVLADRLTTRLGDRTGGAYFERSGALVVTVTDPAAAATVTAAGATAKVVEHSAAELAAAKAALDKAGGVRNSTWGVDTAANKVVLTLPATAPRSTAVEKAAARFGSAVAVRRTGAVLTEQNDIAGGDPIYNSGGSRCSAGFNVTNGATRFVLTAGHCTALGGTWTNYANLYIGPSAGSYFPGQDHGLVRIDSGLPQINGVYLYNGSFQTITAAGSGYAGLYACKSGSTTGVTCGYVQATNVTVNYSQGAVYGTDQTNICTQPGDSGGSYFTGATALGMVSGGTVGGCTSTSRSFFFPVRPALSYWGVSLI